MMTDFIQEHSLVANGWSKWIRPVRKGYMIACCDCGLVHDFDFRIKKEWRGMVIEFRAKRNKKETAKVRGEK